MTDAFHNRNWFNRNWNFDELQTAECLAARHQVTLRWLEDPVIPSVSLLPPFLIQEAPMIQDFESWMKKEKGFQTDLKPQDALDRIRTCINHIQISALVEKQKLLLIEEASFREGFEAAKKKFSKLEVSDLRIVPELIKFSPWVTETKWIIKRLTSKSAEVLFESPSFQHLDPEDLVLFERIKAEWLRGFLTTFIPDVQMQFQSVGLPQVQVKWSI